jgi:hypothetical protein
MGEAGRGWMDIAQRAAAMIGDPSQGGKETALNTACSELNVPAKTLRSYLLAWRFIESLQGNVRVNAAAMPAAAIEIIVRWQRHDPAGAMRAVDMYAPEKHTVRSLRGAEAAARPRRPGLGGRRLELVYRDEIESRLGALQAVWPRSSWPLDLGDDKAVTLPNPSGKADLVRPLRYWKERSRPGKSCAIVIVGPYTLKDLYRSRAMDWCLRALGLTFFHDHVALVLPGSVARRPFIAVLEAAPASRSRITLLRDPGRRNWGKLSCHGRRRRY